MELVATIDQVMANVGTLDAIRTGGDAGEAAVYAGLIKRGTCFLPYSTSEGLAFAPSRFIGYAGNSFARHAANEDRDGRLTNSSLNAILGLSPTTEPMLETEYLNFCAQIGLTPSRTGTFGVARKYWLVPEVRDRLDLIAETAVLGDASLTPTEKEQIAKARVGQGAFRDALLSHWQRKCCLTGCGIEPVLRASHIKPWRRSSNAERLDRFNGLLLTANIDILFDRGLISFSDAGELLRSETIGADILRALGCDPGMRIALGPAHAPYLAFHRAEIFGRP